MTFVSQAKAFHKNYEAQVKVQIDNSLDLGWSRQDIILATNFSFEYNGIKSIIVSDDNFVPYCRQNSKIKTILELLNRGYINGKELYWFHDLDASQAEIMNEPEIAIGEADMAMADNELKGWWYTGSFFFTSRARDIIQSMIKIQDLLMVVDEMAITILSNKFDKEDTEKLKNSYSPEILKKIPKIENVDQRIKKINITYNFVPSIDVRECYDKATKPIKVIHFKPFGAFPMRGIPSLINFYMYGKNDIKTVLMPERLINIYQKHGIK